MFRQKKFALLIKKSFFQNFLQLNLKENTKTMTSDCLYLYGALCWSCRSRLSTSLPLCASSSGVLLSSFFKLMSAPLSNNNRTASVLLFSAAKCSGVYLTTSCLFTSAPSCNRRSMTSVRLEHVAWWRAVQPYLSLTSTGIPSLNIRLTVVTSPCSAA